MMRPATRLCLPSSAAARPLVPLPLAHRLRPQTTTTRALHVSPLAPTASRHADVAPPVYGQGPPPPPPPPFSSTSTTSREARAAAKAAAKAREAQEREDVERRIRIERRKARAAAIHNKATGGRFWKTTSVQAVGDDELQVHLDARPLRHPTTKQIVRLPAGKRVLAHALAAEWDQLTSVRQAAQGHRVPLTSLVCRALDLEAEAVEAEKDSENGRRPQAEAVIESLMRYLDTDSLLCWMPADEVDVFAGNRAAQLLASTRADIDDVDSKPEVTLRQMQEQTARPILAYIKEHVWPGVVVEPVLGGADQANSLFPKPHPRATKAAVAAWLAQLNGWDLAGVERATLAGKSLVVAARLVGSVSPTAPARPTAKAAPLTVEEAFAATSMETAFQTAQWGEVEDTHDVEGADMRRHFGSVVLLVS